MSILKLPNPLPEVRPRKLANGKWGVATQNKDLRQGSRVKVVTKDGTTWEALLVQFQGEEDMGYGKYYLWTSQRIKKPSRKIWPADTKAIATGGKY